MTHGFIANAGNATRRAGVIHLAAPARGAPPPDEQMPR